MKLRLIKFVGLMLVLLLVVTLIPSSPTAAAVFSNSAAITIPDSGASTPYPSTIAVSGLSGTVTRVTATLNGLTHTCEGDLEILLVGPGGQGILLMSWAGSCSGVVNSTLTFDDAAAGDVPAPAVSGTYRPTDFGFDPLPAPAPAAPYGATLSAFNGTNPNGTWSLFVFDSAGGDTGSIANGWSLDITTASAPVVPGVPAAPVPTATPVITWFPGHQDGRLNWHEAYSPVALYAESYGGGRLGLHIYNVGAGGPEPWLYVTPEMIAAVGDHPAQNTLIAQTPDGHIRVYRLASGWFQVQAGPNAEGKTSLIAFDRLCAGNNCATYTLGEIDPQ